MEIPLKKLQRYNDYLIHDDGYRIVYYYENYHEVPSGLYAKKIEDFINYFQNGNDKLHFISKDDIMDQFLERNSNALGVAVYSVDGKCICRKNRDNVTTINNSDVYRDELIHDYGVVENKNGYRIVYFYDNDYKIGSFSPTIEGFMTDFVENEPIIDENDIPEFISIDDLLERYLNDLPNITAVALYKTDGTCIEIKSRKKTK